MPRRGPDARERVRNLVALDAENLMVRLRTRRPDLIALFSRRRDREVFLATLRSWFEEVDARTLSYLRPDQQSATSAFYEAVDALRFYFRYTEDMPGTVERTLDRQLGQLEKHYARLVGVLGGPVPVKLEDLAEVRPAGEPAEAPPEKPADPATVDGEVVKISSRR